ncbi:HAMP domain-containing histidine kinase [Planosporangium flavigriseum]|uniref:histidine kinase n=1 Tax=Planosporangium flavigriseum TaxID=373681 RepID=A0A8J3LQ17_9ACTN|nr:HAMP domain-containing sensor histidine kinase [Planosporangium flavigriseum]NJC67692.1 HAMP domain-containing histidine kinase [Planosporangium flavigriseum]GIG75832.1 two-component sensor histidine kinase [Planosporangium flavigriseum]
MRTRIILLVAATTSLVLVAFLVPLALLVRSTAADRAVSSAIVELQALAPLVSTVDSRTLELAVTRTNAANPHRLTVFLPDGTVIGAAAPRSDAVTLASTGRSLTAEATGGREVLVAVSGLSDGTAVIRTFVSDAELQRGVGRAWLVLCVLGLGLLIVSVAVAHQLARNLTRPLTAVAEVSHRIAQGDLAARAELSGPPEVHQVSAGLNLLAGRIDELLARERENVVDLSHRLRTPLTALRIDAESLRDPDDRERITADLDAVQRTVDAIIRTARRPVRHDIVATCSAREVVAERVAFWSALAADEQRPVEIDLPPDPLPVRAGADDLAACLDALLGNVFAHTPEGCGMWIYLAPGQHGGAELVVADNGPGLQGPLALQRGHSGSGSTGLGLDIVRRVAAASGGSLALGQTPGGGATVTVEFGPPPPGTP